VDQPCGRELLDDDREKLGRHGQIEESIAWQIALALDLLDHRLERLERLGLVGVARVVVERGDQRIVGRDLFASVTHHLAEGLAHHVAIGLVRHRRARESDDREPLRKIPRLLQVEERGDQLAPREIARRPENDERERVLGPDEIEAGVRRAFTAGRRNGRSEPTPRVASAHRRSSYARRS
jgi:hypothetical protein